VVGEPVGSLLSVNVGLPKDVSWQGRTVFTGVFKDPVSGSRRVGKLNVDGDGQGDRAGHGGEQRAVFVYQMDSYRYWERELGRDDFSFGQFGENFTVEGLGDDVVCIGDRYRIGTALFEVTQPRVTCYRVGIRTGEPRMPSLLVAHHRPGFYLRVLEEGEVGSEDEIVKIADGPQRVTVAATDALLYLPGATRDQLQRALNIPALSPGWQSSFRTMLQEKQQGKSPTGASGLAPSEEPPAWPGFRPLRVSQTTRESSSVCSFSLVAGDDRPLSPAHPGQFIVLRIQPDKNSAPLLRSYSLSDVPSADHYRVSIKHELNGAASTYMHTHVRAGDVLDVSAPRGTFALLPGDGPVVLLSAGVGITPMLAMLHSLAAESSQREVWWLHGARNSEDHPFRSETQILIQKLQRCRAHIQYSKPLPTDQQGSDFDAPGHLDLTAIEKLDIPRDADFYLCGPTSFLHDLTTDLATLGVAASHIHSEIFGSAESITPGIAKAAARPAHPPVGPAGQGPGISFARTGLAVQWDPKFQSLLELSEACDVPVKWSCRTGVCHTCETGLVSGAVTYSPEPLQPPAPGNVLICCSKPKGEVVLDL
jgi:ferredoxin-NADP reductase/MOSC domain-containing protein YiiM